jgi:hypothetical protein
MKEERDATGTAQPEKESRVKKYIRLALVYIGVALFLTVIISAALRRYGG